jgi:hypothetical protein
MVHVWILMSLSVGDTLFVISKRVRNLDNFGGLEINDWAMRYYTAITTDKSMCASGSRGARLLNYSTVELHR